MSMSNYKYVERLAAYQVLSGDCVWLTKESLQYPTNNIEALAFKRIAKNSRRKNYLKNVIYTMECEVRHLKKKRGNKNGKN